MTILNCVEKSCNVAIVYFSRTTQQIKNKFPHFVYLIKKHFFLCLTTAIAALQRMGFIGELFVFSVPNPLTPARKLVERPSAQTYYEEFMREIWSNTQPERVFLSLITIVYSCASQRVQKLYSQIYRNFTKNHFLVNNET